MQTLEISTLLCLILVWSGADASQKPICSLGPVSQGLQWLADPDNCSTFYLCHGAQRFEFDCGDNVWDQETKTCVGRGSELTRQRSQYMATSEKCTEGSKAVFAKGDNCAQYYDCSSREATVSSDPTVRECEFPLLFNDVTKQCEHFSQVTCGLREEPLDACGYAANQCTRSSHCIPCNVRFPSCRGLPDGLNPWVGREYSPYFVLCQNQRDLHHGQCQGGQSSTRSNVSAPPFQRNQQLVHPQ
ncbi:hypothetical protein C0Q70_15213 [Pomacea canaliculata]|uniref:Chitin-binding type-2 domain-containing protein n=1 Tax=Pomacea canaliculata TaxID=400727 RepID=A0A2T7NU61_POMCA|nr:hypothetical protein C0Q70_15213 [Pomacea canaliculata]